MPESLFILIVAGSFLASFINAAFALGGAFLMLALITSILPISAVIPLHSPFMFGSLLGRCWLFRQHLVWRIIIPFLCGCVFGVLAGSMLYINFPDWFIALVISGLMLSVWLPGLNFRAKFSKLFFIVGIIHSFLSTVFAYGGILHSLVLRTGLNKEQVTATIAGSLLAMGVLKIAGYTFYGFDYRPYLETILACIPASFLGTWLGKRFSHHISETMFRLIFKIIMTGFGLRLLYLSFQLYID
ncbi:MAG: putative membrane protein YfcA [Halieaceae bacterium]